MTGLGLAGAGAAGGSGIVLGTQIDKLGLERLAERGVTQKYSRHG